uniref:Melanopsin n=1 Tax=Magallana gigas TaxID=29159 RepID=K1P6Y0_MAGGI
MDLLNITMNEVEVPKYPIPIPLYYVIGSGLLIVVTLGPFMNITSLAVFAQNKHLRSPTNIFVISLLLGDVGMSCVALISMVAHFNRYYFWGDRVCVFEGFWLYLMGLTNLYTHAVIAVDRYIVIAKPLSAHRVTKRVAVVAVLVVWIQGLLWASFPHFGWGKYTYEPARTSCAVEWDSKEIGSASYNVAITIWSLCIPLGLIVFSYYRVFMTVTESMAGIKRIFGFRMLKYLEFLNINGNVLYNLSGNGAEIRHVARSGIWDTSSRIARKNLKMEKKMFKTIAYMLVVSVWAIIGESRDIPVYIITIPAVVAKSSCIWDPLIYLWTNRQFRIAFYKTMPCKSLGEKLLQRDELKHKETESSQPQEPQELRHKSNRLTPLRQTTTKQGPAVSVSEYGQKTETMGVSQINVPHVVVQGPSKIGNVC